ncbi:MAG: hypothetical protein Q9219_003537 [cf. Caloplaca sp. 3 TL-2023]
MAFPPSSSTPPAAPVIKRSHSEVGSEDETARDMPFSSKRFSSKIIDIYVGDERYHFAAHEAFLFQSEGLKSQYQAAVRTKKKNSKNPIALDLPRDSPQEIGQLLEYLYLKKLTLHATEPSGQADELLAIWVMGSTYALPDMQRHVIRTLQELDLVTKLPALTFLRLADKLYESEVDLGLRRYFGKVAPDVVRNLSPTDMPVLLEMISEGGSFASDLFHAQHQAFGLKGPVGAREQRPTGADVDKTNGKHDKQAAKRAKTIGVDDKDITPSSSSTTLGRFSTVDPRTAWDDENRIPEAWETANTEDKLLITKAEQGVAWPTIAEAWEKATGVKMDINDLVRRYDRIQANILRLSKGDIDLLTAARTAIEGKFHQEKWALIAKHISTHGGTDYEPNRLKRYCDALDTLTTKTAKTEQQNTLIVQLPDIHQHRHISTHGARPPTEIVGGVRVENSKPIDVRRRRRTTAAPSAVTPRATPAATPSAPKTITNSSGKAKTNKGNKRRKSEAASSDEDDVELGTSVSRREVSSLGTDADAGEKGKEMAGGKVKPRYGGKGMRVPGRMRYDPPEEQLGQGGKMVRRAEADEGDGDGDGDGAERGVSVTMGRKGEGGKEV